MTDEEIIRGMQNGEREAYDAFYADTKETVEKTCSYFLVEDPAMLGAAVGAYQRALHQLAQKHKPGAPLKDWMAVQAVRECFPALLRLRDEYDMQGRQMEEMAGQVPVLQEITADPKERLSFVVRGEADDMPDPYKEFLSLSELQGLSFLEISKRLSSSWSTVVTKLFQARQILAKRVKEQLGI